MTPMRIDFPYLMLDYDRHGNRRLYVRRHGRKVRLRAHPGTEAFAQAYAEALRVLDGQGGPAGAPGAERRACGYAGLAGGLLFRVGRVSGPGP